MHVCVIVENKPQGVRIDGFIYGRYIKKSFYFQRFCVCNVCFDAELFTVYFYAPENVFDVELSEILEAPLL